MVRKPVVGMSYKTYINSIRKAESLAEEIVKLTGQEDEVDQILFPSLGAIYPVATILNKSQIAIGAQNISPAKEGPYTGEVSITSIKEIGGKYIEIGHAERKNIFKETQEMINKKVKLTLESGLVPLLCIGEEERLDNPRVIKERLKEQIQGSFLGVSTDLIEQSIIAYEPVWAIGQKESANAKHVHQTHHLIREIIKELYGESVSKQVRIIYGGSVSEDNAPKIVNNPNVDGVFIGRFGHDPTNYKRIVDIVKELKDEM